MSRDWTEDELEQLRTLYREDDIPLEAIAPQLGRSREAVTQKVNLLGLRRPNRRPPPTFRAAAREWSDAELDNLRIWYREGLPLLEIGRRLGRSEGSINKKLKVLGLKRDRIPQTPRATA
jgi:hypothetical protein